jgi:hypothetical protein
MSGGTSNSQGSSVQASNASLDPEFRSRFFSNADRATGVAENLKAREFAGFTPEQKKAFGITERTATDQPGLAMVNQGAALTTGAGLTPQSISTFLNPYTQNVVDTTLSDIGRQRDIALNENQSKVAAANAFGNTRRGIQEAAVVDPYARAMATEAGKLRSGAYDAATQAAAQAAGIDLSKGSQLGQLGTTAQNLGFQAGEKLAGVGEQIQQLSQAQLDAIRNLPLEQQQIINQALGLNVGGGSGMVSTSSGSSAQQSESSQGLLGTLSNLTGGLF